MIGSRPSRASILSRAPRIRSRTLRKMVLPGAGHRARLTLVRRYFHGSRERHDSGAPIVRADHRPAGAAFGEPAYHAASAVLTRTPRYLRTSVRRAGTNAEQEHLGPCPSLASRRAGGLRRMETASRRAPSSRVSAPQAPFDVSLAPRSNGGGGGTEARERITPHSPARRGTHTGLEMLRIRGLLPGDPYASTAAPTASNCDFSIAWR
jgi:hypothetical protein